MKEFAFPALKKTHPEEKKGEEKKGRKDKKGKREWRW